MCYLPCLFTTTIQLNVYTETIPLTFPKLIFRASAVMGKLGGLRCIGKKLNSGSEFCISTRSEKNIHNKNFP